MSATSPVISEPVRSSRMIASIARPNLWTIFCSLTLSIFFSLMGPRLQENFSPPRRRVQVKQTSIE